VAPTGDDAKQPAIETAVEGILKNFGFLEAFQGLSGLTPGERELKYFEALTALKPGQYERAFQTAYDLIGPHYIKIGGKRHNQFYDLLDEYNRRVRELFDPELSGNPAPTSATVEPPKTQTYEPLMVEDDRIITKQGGRYFPISLAANFAQAPRTTLLNWIKAKVKFQGRPLQIYHSPTARKAYLAEESVQRVANRFTKWPSEEPAGPVTIGETHNQSGYIGISKAARKIGVDPHTMWLWTTHGKAPTDKPLDLIKCMASDQFYIRERDVNALKAFVPRSGLRPGRRAKVLSAPAPKFSPR
jgi:hypothetical protein